MQQLPDALSALAEYPQFFLYKLVPNSAIPGKTDKLPCNMYGEVHDAHDPRIWLDAETALNTANMFGPEYGAAFVFTENDPFFFIDLDNVLQVDNTWNEISVELMDRFAGCAIEVSQSGKGLHIFGKSIPSIPSELRKKKCLLPGKEFDMYTQGRFVALTGINTLGDAGFQVDQTVMDAVVADYLTKTMENSDEWTSEPDPRWGGYENDEDLIEKAKTTGSAGTIFGAKASFKDLWENNIDVLRECYPDEKGLGEVDESRADGALAQHLAFWTGNDCERILNLMKQSELVRPKWDRDDYLDRTIRKAKSMQVTFHNLKPALNPEGAAIAEQYSAPKLRGNSEAQISYATSIRADKLAACMGDEDTIKALCRFTSSKFWLDNKDKTPEALVAATTPIESAHQPLAPMAGPQVVEGFQYLSADLQKEHFAGCVYVIDLHRVFTPKGALLKSDQFNAVYGGYVFQLDSLGSKTTRKAWEAFTESQVVRYPIADSTCFRPMLSGGTMVTEYGESFVNTYIPIETPQTSGDAKPFLDHLFKLLPDEQDRMILLSYMAACVQHKGVKFQWAPLIQGTEGNGKTFFTSCVEAAIGKKYSFRPSPKSFEEKYNDWLFGKLIIGIEDVYVPSHKQEVIEVLKPMITNTDLSERAMREGQQMRDNYANFILNSNHKDAIRKSRNDRRFCVFYTAQQSEGDIERDGMGGNYFPELYRWARDGGFAIITHYLATFDIPAELNPAGECHRAPKTTSTDEAITASLGGVEQEILEAIDEGRVGFKNGWVSSMAIERLLQTQHMTRLIPRNKRKDVMQSIGYEWHPHLIGGRASKAVPCDGGKPKLFIKNGHVSLNLTDPTAITEAYEKAQGDDSKAQEAFGRVMQ